MAQRRGGAIEGVGGGGVGLLAPQDSDMRIHLRSPPLDPYSYLGMLWQFPHSPRPLPECQSSREPKSWRKQMNSAAVLFLLLPRRPFMLVQYPHHSAELLLLKSPHAPRHSLTILPLCRRFRGDGSIPSPPFCLSSFGSADNEKASFSRQLCWSPRSGGRAMCSFFFFLD